ncbi:MAG TPA: efflux RND transporter periplasmic adaptor subunit [Blastocatellia bacterium]|nr:efflux RND transporter periplasmic adaptor subunit [Blastocatellia bacterium]
MGRNLCFVALCLLILSLASCKERPVEPQSSAAGKEESTQPNTQTPEPGTPRRGVEESEQRPQLTVPSQALEGKTFQTALVERRAFRDELQATATIKPDEYRLVHVSPRIEGRALDIQVQLGDQVKPGQPLALLDSIELGQKKAAFLQAMTNRDVDRRNFEREKGLFEQRISSEKEYLAVKGAYEKSLAAYRAAYEALRLIGLSEEEIKKINWSEKGKPLSSFPLLAPQAGTVIERPFTRGELITPKDNAFTIADLSTVWILLDIYEQHLAAVTVGNEVEIKVDAYPRETFRGKIVYLSYVLKPETRTVDARVEIPNPGLRLRPGMFARAILTLPNIDDGQKVVTVPQDAIQQVDEKPVAFVEERPGTYSVRELVIGRRSGTDVEVRSGLAEGERVVTQGSFYLKSILLKERIAGG